MLSGGEDLISINVSVDVAELVLNLSDWMGFFKVKINFVTWDIGN